MTANCHRCNGAGWELDTGAVCVVCDGNGHKDGTLTPYEIMPDRMITDLRRDVSGVEREQFWVYLALSAGALVYCVARLWE